MTRLLRLLAAVAAALGALALLRWRPVEPSAEPPFREDDDGIQVDAGLYPSWWDAQTVWGALEALPGFNEELREAEAELEAGGGVRYRVVDGRFERVP